MSALTAFNTCLMQWIDELIETYPDDYDFKTFKNAIIALKKVNPRQIHTSFVSNVGPYRAAIAKRDEDFIIKSATVELSESSKVDDAGFLITKLNKYWTEMSENNRNANWKYIDVLLMLADKC